MATRVATPLKHPYRIDIIRTERWLMMSIIGTPRNGIK
jgi:hypothetical protein